MEKIQKYLKEHGHDEVVIDGIYGPITQAALYDILGISDDEKKEEAESHFSREEFRCKCGGKYCTGFPAEPSETLINALEDIRSHFGDKPVYIISGLRCETWNTIQGGVTGSYHTKGRAADIQISGVTPADLLAYCKTLSPHYTYICNPSVHIDF